MKCKQLYTFFLLTALSVSIVVFLASRGNTNQAPNGFKRKYIATELSVLLQQDLSDPLYSIVGSTGEGYLFCSKSGEYLLTDTQLTQERHFRLLDTTGQMAAPFHTFIQPGKIMVLCRPLQTIIYATITGFIDSMQPVPVYYSDAIPVSTVSFVLRINDTQTDNKVFAKYNRVSSVVYREDNISRNTADMGFANDGKLTYDPAMHKIIYIHFYCNEIICMDTNLQLIYRSRTIDTFEQPRCQARVFLSPLGKKSASFTTPRKQVNAHSTVDGSYLYVESFVKADNETNSSFRRNMNIDVYALSNGEYVGSFYLPTLNGSHIKHFRVFGKKILALYPTAIVQYRNPL